MPPMFPETVASPYTKLLPGQSCEKANEPTGVSNVPPLLSNFQPMVEMPVPPIFSSVPVLMK